MAKKKFEQSQEKAKQAPEPANQTPETDNQAQKKENMESIKDDFISRYGNLFLWVLLGFCIAFGIFLVCANREFRKSQEKIKQSYMEHIKKADSLYFDMISYNNDYISHMSDANATVLTDSLIRLTLGQKQKLSAEQYNRLHELLAIQFKEIKQLHERYDGKIQRDSLQLMTERQLLEGQVKTMLDLHLNKIEHEYSNITLWAAVLTILFLVFSFYSIFKMDSLVHQGNEGVKEIKKLGREGEVTIQRITEKGDNLVSNSKGRIDQLVEETNSKLASFISNQQKIIKDTVEATHQKIYYIKDEAEQSFRDIAATKEDMGNIRDESVRLLNEKLSEIEKKYDDAVGSKVKELNTYIDELQNMISDLKQKISKKYKDDNARKEGNDEL